MKQQAIQVLAEIDEYLTQDNTRHTSSQLTDKKDAILKILADLEERNFRAAFIGKINAGKTSAICRAVGLQAFSKDNSVIDLLKTGAGRVTVCEVRIEYEAKFSIRIVPMPLDEVGRVVRNFADFIWAKANKHVADQDEGGNLLSEELTRCIRNMLGLNIENRKEGNKWRSTDKALEFCRDCSSVDEVNQLMFDCLDLESRTQTELWPSPEETETWGSWLKTTFAQVNDGKHNKVSIPSLITIAGPFPFQRDSQHWSIADTRGIDSYIHREDLRSILDTAGTFPVVCSTFGDAPDADCRSFINLAVDLGMSHRISRDGLLLVLDKNESHKVSDIDEEVVDIRDRKEIGRAIREGQVQNKILHDFNISPNILTFDSHLDDNARIWQALDERRRAYIDSKHKDLERLISASRELLSAEEAKAAAFKSDIDNLVAEWRERADAYAPDWQPFGKDIGEIFSQTNHRRLAASIDKRGSFDNLDVYETINQLARSRAVAFCGKEEAHIRDALAIVKKDYPEFANQVDSLEAEFAAQLAEFAARVGDLAKNHWIDRVKSFLLIWQTMEDEWGRGRGYKNRVLAHWQAWTSTDDSISIHNALLRRIASAWGRVLADV